MPLPVLPDSQLRLSEEAGGQEAAPNCLLLAKAAEVRAVGLVDRVVVVAAEEVAANAGERAPNVLALPTRVNRTGCLEHIAEALWSIQLRDVRSPLPIAWQNVPVQLLNRGPHALEPLGVPSEAVVWAAALAIAALSCACLACFRVPRCTHFLAI